jgi:hypothetical protein
MAMTRMLIGMIAGHGQARKQADEPLSEKSAAAGKPDSF